MSNLLKTVTVGALLAVGLAFASAVYAEQNPLEAAVIPTWEPECGQKG